MGDASWIGNLFLFWVGLAAVTFISLFFIRAPYGRHEREGWGPRIPSRMGWVVMELPSPLLLLFLFFQGEARSFDALLFLVCWVGHYLYRAGVYPFLARLTGKTMPVSVALLAIVFNVGNAGFNGLTNFQWLPLGSGEWGIGRMTGMVMFCVGFMIHVHSDAVLRGLRKRGETGYQVPREGMHRWVASPNYLGEIVEWMGLAIAFSNPATWSFAIWTAANLVPRAHSHLQWYRETFPDYPNHRKALIPGLF